MLPAPTKPQMININGEIHSSKNSRRVFRSGQRVIVAKSKAAKQDEENIHWQLVEQAPYWECMKAGKAYPFYVCFFFRRQTRARWDFANLVQGIADAMVKAEYIPDDDVSHFIPVYMPHTIDRRNPGCDFCLL